MPTARVSLIVRNPVSELAAYYPRSLRDLCFSSGFRDSYTAVKLIQLNLVAVLLDGGHDVEGEGEGTAAVFE